MKKNPEDFKCPAGYRKKWLEYEKKILPLIEASARTIKRKAAGVVDIDLDDAIQEGRLILFIRLIQFDEKKGSLEKFASKILSNAYKTMLYQMLTKRRTPQAKILRNGVWETGPIQPLLMDNEDYFFAISPDANKFLSKIEAPCEAVERNEVEAQIKIFNLKLLNKLKPRDKLIFECITNPPTELLKMIQNTGGDVNNPMYVDVAKYLGLNINAVQYSLHRIRTTFTELAKEKDFIELFENQVDNNGCQMIHVSKKLKHDVEFVKKIITERKLDPIPVEGYHLKKDFRQEFENYARQIERYPWGVVLILKYGKFWRTIVIEGNFIPSNGIVIGQNGTREKLPVKWYPELVRKLNGGKNGK